MKFVENEVTFVMWFMYEYTENEIAELNQSYDTRLSEEEKKKISMSTGYIKDGRTYVTKGPLQGREKMISRIDRHKRLAKLSI